MSFTYDKSPNLTATSVTVSSEKKNLMLGTIRFSLEIIEDTIMFTREIVFPNHREPISITTEHRNEVDESLLTSEKYYYPYRDTIGAYVNVVPLLDDLTILPSELDAREVPHEIRAAFSYITNRYLEDISQIVYIRYFSRNPDKIVETGMFSKKFFIQGPVILDGKNLYCGTLGDDEHTDGHVIATTLEEVLDKLNLTDPISRAYANYAITWREQTAYKQWTPLFTVKKPAMVRLHAPVENDCYAAYQLHSVDVEVLESTDYLLRKAQIHVYYLIGYQRVITDYALDHYDMEYLDTDTIALYHATPEGLIRQLTNDELLTGVLHNYHLVRPIINDIITDTSSTVTHKNLSATGAGEIENHRKYIVERSVNEQFL